MNDVCRADSLVDFVSDDDVGQAVWEVPDAQTGTLVEALGKVGGAYIVDGHHRVAAAARVGDATFLAGLVPDDQLHLLPYHRLVAGPLPLSPAAIVERLGALPSAEPVGRPGPGEVGLYLDGRWFRARLDGIAPRRRGRRPAGARTVGRRDRPPHDPRLDFVPGSVDTVVLSRLADHRRGMVVAVHPPSVDQLFAEADAGRILPPKSTWFEPKFHSGVFVVRRPPLAVAD